MEGSGSGSGSSSSSKGGTLRRNAKRLSVLLRSGSKDLLEGSAGASSFAGLPQPQPVPPPSVTALEQQQKQLSKAERPAQRRNLESKREQLKSYIVCFRPFPFSFFFSFHNSFDVFTLSHPNSH